MIVAGANLQLDEKEIMLAEGLISKSKVLVCQLEIRPEVTLAALKLAKKHGGLSSWVNILWLLLKIYAGVERKIKNYLFFIFTS